MLEWAQITKDIASGESRHSLEDNRLLRHALTRTLQNIGEAANNVTVEARRENTTVLWAEIIGMRHRLVHVYYAIDLDVIWTTVTDFVPPLIDALRRLLAEDET